MRKPTTSGGKKTRRNRLRKRMGVSIHTIIFAPSMTYQLHAKNGYLDNIEVQMA